VALRPHAFRLTAGALILAAGLGVGMQPPHAARASATSLIPGIGLVHLGDTLSNASNPSSYSTVIVSQDDAPAAAALAHAAGGAHASDGDDRVPVDVHRLAVAQPRPTGGGEQLARGQRAVGGARLGHQSISPRTG